MGVAVFLSERGIGCLCGRVAPGAMLLLLLWICCGLRLFGGPAARIAAGFGAPARSFFEWMLICD
jgi:hypothetical protein